MSEIADLIKVMQEQMQRQEERHQQQLTVMQQQLDEQRKSTGTFASQKQTPPFPASDSTAELWKDYLLRFKTFVSANSVPGDKLALVFLTNQTSDTYKLINNYASQQDTPTTADNMQFSDIAEFMSQHYDPTKFTVRERYKFWSSTKRKPGETPTELAARVRQMATTCDFPAIKNPLDEAMRTCFICAINNEAVLKSVFREPEEKLTFSKAVDIATEVEEAAKTAKAQVYSKPEEVHKIQTKKQYHHHQKSAPSSKHASIQYTDTVLLLWEERPCDEGLQTVQPSLQILRQEGTHWSCLHHKAEIIQGEPSYKTYHQQTRWHYNIITIRTSYHQQPEVSILGGYRRIL